MYRNLNISIAMLLVASAGLQAIIFSPTLSHAEKSSKESSAEIKKSEEKSEDSKDAESEIPPSASAPQANIEAGNLSYDNEKKILYADDDVVLTYKNNELRAKHLQYNRSTRLITAEDGVEYINENGSLFIADKMVMEDNMKKGTLTGVEGKMADGSKFFSESLQVISKNEYNLKNASYSPCKPCKENGQYLWKLEAEEIIYDEDLGRVTYNDARLKVLDHTVGYTPWISHPTPFSESKSGFLTPSMGKSSNYGFYLTTPYYYQLDRSTDFTFTPTVTTDDGPILMGEFRKNLYYGDYKFEASGAYPDERDELGKLVPDGDREFRGHVKTSGNFQLDDFWDVNFDAKRTSDDTYLQRYNFGYEDILKSELETNRIKGRDYFQMKALSFQGLRQNDDPDITPYVLPEMTGGVVYEYNDFLNSKIGADVNSFVLRRSEGAQSSRAVTNLFWKGSQINSLGHVLDYKLTSRYDHFVVDEQPYLGTQYNGNVDRYIPTASVKWSLPLVNYTENTSVVIQPIGMAVISPNGANDSRIPNEDSQNIELYDYNLFQEDHFSGYDYAESGFRANYGLQTVVKTNEYGNFSTLLGQNYRDRLDPFLTAATGMDDYLSDYVGRVTHETYKHFTTNYRFRVDKENMQLRRNEISATIDLEPIVLTTGYNYFDDETTPERQELFNMFQYNYDEKWALLASSRRNLDNTVDNGWVNARGGIQYTNECVKTLLEVNREFTRDRDLEPSTEIFLRIALQNLGT